MDESLELQEFFRNRLAFRLAELKGRNPSYSLRAFSRDLGQNPAAISQILSKKRRVSKGFAIQIGQRMGLTLEELKKIQAGDFDKKNGQDSKESLIHGRTPLALAQYDLVAEWHYYAILSLSETKTFRSDPRWIANRLGISKKKVTVALRRLEEMRLLTRNSRGEMRHSGQSVTTADEIPSLAVRKRHEENLESARQSLFQHPLESRDFTFITMAIDPERIPAAKKRIRRFMNELCRFLEQGSRTEIYEICTQLFPRTTSRRHHEH